MCLGRGLLTKGVRDVSLLGNVKRGWSRRICVLKQSIWSRPAVRELLGLIQVRRLTSCIVGWLLSSVRGRRSEICELLTSLLVRLLDDIGILLIRNISVRWLELHVCMIWGQIRIRV